MWYKDFLPCVHAIIQPRRYVEIGMRKGQSLSFSAAEHNLAIDPSFGSEDLEFEVGPTKFFKMTSDDFFKFHSLEVELGGKFDLAYIDGMHLFEFALRDFINLEKSAAPGAVIMMDDVMPETAEQAGRNATGGMWAGDVWKVVECLYAGRPDLAPNLILAASKPFGCLLVRGLDPASTLLEDRYEALVARHLEQTSTAGAPDDAYFARATPPLVALAQLAESMAASAPRRASSPAPESAG